jgi:hypothetical protein
VPRGRGRPGAPPPCIRASYAAYRYTARYRTRGLCSRSHANAAAANSSCNAATLLARHYELVLGMDAPTPTHLDRTYGTVRFWCMGPWSQDPAMHPQWARFGRVLDRTQFAARPGPLRMHFRAMAGSHVSRQTQPSMASRSWDPATQRCRLVLPLEPACTASTPPESPPRARVLVSPDLAPLARAPP